MDILSQVISGMTKEQVRYFKMFMAGNGKSSRKDLTLFDYIRKHEGGYDDDKIFRKIFSSS